MERKHAFALALVAILFILAAVQLSMSLDKLTGYVNDEAGVISPEYNALITNELSHLKDNTSVEMVVATVESLNNTPIEEYSLNLAHKVLGEKGKDNGILILLAVKDREYRIEVGYGLEPIINAALAGRIGREVMEPSFKAGNYEKGIYDAAVVISGILRNDTSWETTASAPAQDNKQVSVIVVILFIAAILFIIIISSYFSEKKLLKDAKSKNSSKNAADPDFTAAAIIASMFGKGGMGRGGFGGGSFGGGSSGGFGGFGGGSFGGGGFSGKF